MTTPFESRPPPAAARVEAALASAGVAPCLDVPTGELARVLAASHPAGVCLVMGPAAGEAGAWILDGMDLSSRLVLLTGDDRDADRLRPVFDADLRVTVHAQPAEDFLGDVGGHRFQLIADLFTDPPEDRARLALGLLATGGCYLCRHPVSTLAEALGGDTVGPWNAIDTDALVSTTLEEPPGVTLAVLGPARTPARRRGGRGRREGVTPLFNSGSRGE